MFKTIKLMCAAGLLAVAGAGVGCSATSAEGVRSNWSPELHSTARSFEQHRNMEARAIDGTSRQAWDDGAMLLLVHRPLRLTRYPVP